MFKLYEPLICLPSEICPATEKSYFEIVFGRVSKHSLSLIVRAQRLKATHNP